MDCPFILPYFLFLWQPVIVMYSYVFIFPVNNSQRLNSNRITIYCYHKNCVNHSIMPHSDLHIVPVTAHKKRQLVIILIIWLDFLGINKQFPMTDNVDKPIISVRYLWIYVLQGLIALNVDYRVRVYVRYVLYYGLLLISVHTDF